VRLDGKVAIVTGGVQGLGGAHTEALVSHGADVVVADIRDEEGATFAARLNARAGGERVHYVHLDVRDASYHWLDASPPGIKWREKQLRDPTQEKRDAAWSPEQDLPL